MTQCIEERIRTLCGTLKALAGTNLGELPGFEYVLSGFKTSNTPPQSGWQPVTPETTVTGKWQHAWFRGNVHTPAAVDGKKLIARVSTGIEDGWDALRPQVMVYLDGTLYQALDVNHSEFTLEFDTDYDMALYFFLGSEVPAAHLKISLVLVDTELESLYYDFQVPLDACSCMDPSGNDYIAIMRVLGRAAGRLNLCDTASPAFFDSVRQAAGYLREELYGRLAGSSDAVVDCIGHTHIDVAWLWPLSVTREKAQCSFATVLRLMREYPEYKFMSSQPQLYQYVKEDDPELYERICQAIREGRWEAEGAMWVEADCNLISGESMVRQLLYGKRFFQQEFGVDNHILWLPDVFGYSAALPQILRKSGVDRFVTSKISWNDHNRMPYDTFLWQGIDGTEVFTYFLTAQTAQRGQEPPTITTYVGRLTPQEIIGAWRRYQQKHLNDHVLDTFGFGDGGGGPTKQMLEVQRRLSHGLPGVPQTAIRTAHEFLEIAYDNFTSNCAQDKETPRWVGELYLEFHRGTYTTMAANKRGNRKSELLYQKAEGLSVLANLLTGAPYPQQRLGDGWRTILLNQFHDIIPGSSILEVYQDSHAQYSEVLAAGEALAHSALESLAAGVKTGGGILVYNPNGFANSDAVRCGEERIFARDIPAFGWRVVQPETPARAVSISGRTAQNGFYVLRLDENGNIASLFDKENRREVFRAGEPGNRLELFEDMPAQYDAWELTSYYESKMWPVDEVESIEPLDEGVRAGFLVKRKFLHSSICQRIYLYADMRRIDFETSVHWQESHLLLKAAFPFDIRTAEATYDIQFGNLKRPTHRNTSWEQAKYEVCAHKWADLSENGFGVSLLNDCKYGHSAQGSTLKLSLLRSPKYPNPQADMGDHSFTYSLLPHAGDFRSATVQAAQALNQPMLALPLGRQDGTLPEAFSFVSADKDNVIIETVKQAEDGDGLIVRMYEAYNRRCQVTLKFGMKFREIWLSDLMEHPQQKLADDTDTVALRCGCYEILTLKLIR
ncbi:MAG: alpha-mannosidase [Eubacteriales bacterium]|nr:alpha-mannosidase [Eubacteriales bacterium]